MKSESKLKSRSETPKKDFFITIFVFLLLLLPNSMEHVMFTWKWETETICYSYSSSKMGNKNLQAETFSVATRAVLC